MSELTDRLTKTGEQHKGTDLGGLLQWAVLHIADQDEALAEVREDYANVELERLRLESAAYDTKTAIEAALAIVSAPLFKPSEFMRDLAPHINLMAAHGDQNYLKKNGMSIRHIDCRETKTRRKSE
jgi:hypothetical protein